MTNPTSNYSWVLPTSSDLVTDLPADFEVALQGVDTTTKALNPSTTLGDIEYRSATANTNTRLPIGTTGQVLTVAGGVPTWSTGTTGDIEGVTAGTGISGGGTSGTVTVTNSMATAMTTKGDLVVATGSGTFVRQGVGTNNQVLMADSVEADGVKWAAEATATLTTTGDTLYASAANTLARRAIGSTGQVLTVSGGLPTWATPASGLTTTLIANGTLSGASLTLSSLSSYDQITVLFDTVAVSANGQFRCRINNNSTSNYWGAGNAQVGSSSNSNSYYPTTSIISFDNLASSGFAAGQNYFALTFFNCKNAGFTNFTYTGSFINGSNTRTNEVIAGGVYAVAEAVSSLVFVNTGGNFSSGTYRIYGA